MNYIIWVEKEKIETIVISLEKIGIIIVNKLYVIGIIIGNGSYKKKSEFKAIDGILSVSKDRRIYGF